MKSHAIWKNWGSSANCSRYKGVVPQQLTWGGLPFQVREQIRLSYAPSALLRSCRRASSIYWLREKVCSDFHWRPVDDFMQNRADSAVTQYIGREQRPILIIDDFVATPPLLVDEATKAAFRPDVRFFPGVQAPFSFDRMADMIAPHHAQLQTAFGGEEAYRPIECGFALVTTPPARLAPLQRIPHIDTTDDTRLAVLVYLSGKQFGGTAFYRHRSTGFEWLNEARLGPYNQALDKDVATHGPPKPEYISADTPLFEQIATVEPIPGRAVIYKSNSLHSGMILNAHALPHDPTTGRLTLNAFFTPGGVTD